MPGFFNAQDYIDVQERIVQFWNDHPNGAIRTHMESPTDDFERCRFRADVYKDFERERPDATGYAFEVAGGKGANSTSHEENCETSAIGRALANMGYATSRKDRPSRQEMRKVEAAPQAAQRPQDMPKSAPVAQDTSAVDAVRESAMKRLHAVGKEHNISHDELRELAQQKGAAGGIGIYSLKDAPPLLLKEVADAIQNDPARIRAWLDKRAAAQQEMMPGVDVLPNPDPARFTR